MSLAVLCILSSVFSVTWGNYYMWSMYVRVSGFGLNVLQIHSCPVCRAPVPKPLTVWLCIEKRGILPHRTVWVLELTGALYQCHWLSGLRLWLQGPGNFFKGCGKPWWIQVPVGFKTCWVHNRGCPRAPALWPCLFYNMLTLFGCLLFWDCFPI